MTLKSQTILVTGGARRIGAEIARELASRGAGVVIHHNRSASKAEALATSLRRSFGVEAWTVRQDLAQPRAGDDLFDACLDATDGRLSAIVNSASDYAADAEASQAIHLDAPLSMMQRLAAMPGTEAKAAVNILDCRVEGGSDPAHAPYLDAKRKLHSLTAHLAGMLAPRLRVNAVAPGAILAQDGEDESAFARLAGYNVLGRTGAPSDVARAVAFLLESDFITGQTIFCDGGYRRRLLAAVNTPLISIEKLKLAPILGVYAEERSSPQTVEADIELKADVAEACTSDNLADTIDYHALALEITAQTAPPREFMLIERLADEIASICLSFDKRIKAASVAITKPSAMPELATASKCRITAQAQ